MFRKYNRKVLFRCSLVPYKILYISSAFFFENKNLLEISVAQFAYYIYFVGFFRSKFYPAVCMHAYKRNYIIACSGVLQMTATQYTNNGLDVHTIFFSAYEVLFTLNAGFLPSSLARISSVSITRFVLFFSTCIIIFWSWQRFYSISLEQRNRLGTFFISPCSSPYEASKNISFDFFVAFFTFSQFFCHSVFASASVTEKEMNLSYRLLSASLCLAQL